MKAQIQGVTNDIITVSLPPFDGFETYTIEPIAATGTALTVKDNTGATKYDYIIIDDGERSEIVQITDTVTRGTSLTIGATVFAHGSGVRVRQIRYNQVAVYGSSSAVDTAPTIIGSLTAIDVKNGGNVILASTTYDYYYARWYNEQTTTYTSYSDSVSADGLSARAKGEIKKEYLSAYNERIDDLITDDWLDRAINRWQRELMDRRKNWSVLRATELSNLAEDTQGYDLPDDIFDDNGNDSIISVKVYNEPDLTYEDNTVFRGNTFDNIGTTVKTAASVGGTSLTLTDSSDFTQLEGTCYCKGVKIGYSLNTESTGVLSTIVTCTACTAFADAGDDVHVVVTAAGHGYTDGDTIYIGSTRNYDGQYTVSSKTTDTFEIVATFVADDATGATSTVDDSITEALSAGDEVWQTVSKGQPMRYTIDNGSIKLRPVPDGVWNRRNLLVEYWKKFPVLDDDSDETLFLSPANCLLYLHWQASIRRKMQDDIQIIRQQKWKNHLEDLVSKDTDFQDIRIQPRNIYSNPY